MIRHLTLKDVGPARDLKFAFSPRLNVLTGDNGLGKTFVLDVIWWALTMTWAGEKAFPWRPPQVEGAGSTSGGGSGPRAHSTSGGGSGPRAHSTSGGGSGPRAHSTSGGGSGPHAHSTSGGGASSESETGEIRPEITALLGHREGEAQHDEDIVAGGVWKWEKQEWMRKPSSIQRRTAVSKGKREQADEVESRPRSLVVYARIDGSYAVFDTLYAKGGMSTFADTAIVLSPSELWNGKEVADPEVQGGKRTVIGGLLADWVSWQQRSKSEEFGALRKVLHALWPPREHLNLDLAPTRVHLRDRRDIPVVSTDYAVVPVTLVSAGMKRALSLAYLLVWAWTEHEKAAKESRQKPTRDVVLLIDEPELHQHPSWQRAFLPAVLKAIGMIAPNAAVQVFTATHSPLVLASLENAWVETLDDLFVMERDGSLIKAEELPFTKEGDVSAWLASTVFGRAGGRSREAELAIAAAMDVMAGRTKDAETNLAALEAGWQALATPPQERPARGPHPPLVERVHDALTRTLPGHDRFWARWVKTWDQHDGGQVRS
jgi:hypothetical protein